ncbi:Protein CBG15593 [Caenorhabditis briggsae]|uniref:Protein CBG15593 n=1 Tax=Caenorhabditis briggsae TaxID=6238 RepID=A8XM30_CAEBR|nr:Protein CBG15593 [Caenorhabditis briggsae]CAP33705.1 Protein CBG15593 [Caenorhabditis briggsae]
MEVEDQSEGGTERDASEEADVQIQEEEGDEEGGEISVGNTLETREGEETEVQKLQAKLYAAERKLVEERNHRKEELAEITKLHQSLVAEKEELRLKNLTNQAKIKELENQHWADRKEVEDLKKMMDRDVIAERKKNDALQAAIAEAEKFFEMGRNCLKEEKKRQ